MENPSVGIFEGISPRAAGGEETERVSARASENDRGGLILNPSDWRILDETRRILATPDGTDALSDVKLKHAALTRRFDDTPYNLASCPLPPSSRPLGTTGFLCLPRILPSLYHGRVKHVIAIADPASRGYSAQYDRRIAFFFLKAPWHILRDIGRDSTTMPLHRWHLCSTWHARCVSSDGEDKSFCRWLRLNKDDRTMTTRPPAQFHHYLFAVLLKMILIREAIDK